MTEPQKVYVIAKLLPAISRVGRVTGKTHYLLDANVELWNDEIGDDTAAFDSPEAAADRARELKLLGRYRVVGKWVQYSDN